METPQAIVATRADHGDMGERDWNAFQAARRRFFATLAELPPQQGAAGGARVEETPEGWAR